MDNTNRNNLHYLDDMEINPDTGLPNGFDYLANIDPTIIQSVRYASTFNFVGEVIDGYKAKKIIISKEAGKALAKVQE